MIHAVTLDEVLHSVTMMKSHSQMKAFQNMFPIGHSDFRSGDVYFASLYSSEDHWVDLVMDVGEYACDTVEFKFGFVLLSALSGH